MLELLTLWNLEPSQGRVPICSFPSCSH